MYKEQSALVIGAGRSGKAIARLLSRLGANVTLCDDNNRDYPPPDVAQLTPGSLVVPSPVIPLTHPLLVEAARRGLEIVGELELASRLTRATILAVTGTNGKTTVTTLLGELMRAQFGAERVGVCGNIGVPMADVVDRRWLVAEVSSYQLETASTFHPRVAAVLNLTPDHLQRHGDMATYQAMKERVFANQTADDFLVLNADDSITRDMARRAASQVCLFSRRRSLVDGAFVDGGDLVLNWHGVAERVLPRNAFPLPGDHNVENALAAMAMACLAGVDLPTIRRVLSTFKGVEHRIEFVRALGGVEFYNDSKATNTDAADKALLSFPGRRIVLIAGGDDKGTDLAEFMRLARERCSAMVLLGAAADRFAAAAADAGVANVQRVGYDLPRAVAAARALARPGDVVLLSPACASFDMFSDYEQRGRAFKEIVNALQPTKGL